MDKRRKSWDMIRLQSFTIWFPVLFGIILLFPTQSYAETTGSIAITLTYTNGDTADYYPVSLKIYQDFDKNPYKLIGMLSGNPFNIVSLPVGHKYKIETFANSMFSSATYVDLQQIHQDVTVKLPLPGGMRINVFYNDKLTPIPNSTIIIRSADNKTWAHDTTNNDGQSMRFWMAPTISSDDHYIIDVKIGGHLVYSQSSIYLRPGIPQEIKVVTDWPPVINSLVTVKLEGIQDVSKDKFLVDMYDNSGKKVSESVLTSRGEAYFSNIIVGDYSFVAVNQTSNTKWGNLDATIDDTKTTFEIPRIHSQPAISNQSSTQAQVQVISQTWSCNCVAFRLDNVQDYWLDNVQINIMNTFYQKDSSLTIGVIGNVFGNDVSLVNHTKTEMKKIDIGISGWNFEDFTMLDKHSQVQLLEQAKTKIIDIFDITPSVFIPPYGKINNDTFFAMSDAGIQFLSSTSDVLLPSDLNGKVYSLPAKITDESFLENDSNVQFVSNIKSTINKDGFAIITLSFQDFAQNNGTEKINIPDMTKIQRLESLIDSIQNNGIKVVSLKDIIKESSLETQIPSWIKNNAKWWSDDTISDDEFIKAIQYLVQNRIIKVPQAQSGTSFTHTIPSWIKNNAKWWSDDTISDDEFIKAIQYLVQNRIIKT